MVGSGLGCALSVVLLERMNPAATFLAFALIAVVAGALLALRVPDRRQVGGRALVAAVVVLGAYLLALNPMAAPFYMKSHKSFPKLEKSQIYERTSNSLAILDFFDAGNLTGFWGADFQTYFRHHPDHDIPARVGYLIDGWALTFAYSAEGEITEEPIYDYVPAAIVHTVHEPEEVLIIGSGGGIDVINALRNGATDITAVDINPAIMAAGTHDLAEFNQGIFHREGVTPVVAEGRSYLTAAGDRQWDLIQLSGVDTLAATQAGAFTLSENYLYTLEAFTTYFDHLAPGGVLTLTRWMYDPPRQTLRVITLTDAVLRQMGIEDPAQHIILIGDKEGFYSVILMSVTPFTGEQSRQVLAACEHRGFVPLALPHMQVGAEPNDFEALIALEDKQAFIADYPFDITVTTDNAPFFMEHTRWRNVLKYPDYIFDKSNGHLLLAATTLIVALFATLFILVPARFIRRDDARKKGRGRALAYFSCLGLAYVLIEMVLVQKLTLFLGNPSYALAVVLCAMLIFSGLGSMLTVYLPGAVGKRLIVICATIAAVLVLYRLALDPILAGTLHLPIAARIALVLGLLAIPATAMGMPFPTAIAALGTTRQDLVVGGWVVNGYFSVLASCAAMVFSISFGFHAVLLVGAAVYAIAAVCRPIPPEAA